MRASFAILVTAALSGCSSEGTGSGKSTFAGDPGGPSAFGTSSDAPSFGENGSSAPSFGADGSGSPSFGSNAGSGAAFGSNGPEGGDPTRICNGDSDCDSGSRCSETTHAGFCFATCTGSMVCPAGLDCVLVDTKSRLSVCLRACSGIGDCPAISGLVGQCAKASSTQSFCLWKSASTTTEEPAPAGG